MLSSHFTTISTDKMHYLTVKEVEAINQYIILKYSPNEPIGLKDRSMLESSVYRPQQSAFGKDVYPTIETKAAALFESLAQNRPFHNANKKTAFASLTQFLYYNVFDFEMLNQWAQADFTVDVVNHKNDFVQIASTIKEYSFQL